MRGERAGQKTPGIARATRALEDHAEIGTQPRDRRGGIQDAVQ